jgi:hypothetical protein
MASDKQPLAKASSSVDAYGPDSPEDRKCYIESVSLLRSRSKERTFPFQNVLRYDSYAYTLIAEANSQGKRRDPVIKINIKSVQYCDGHHTGQDGCRWLSEEIKEADRQTLQRLIQWVIARLPNTITANEVDIYATATAVTQVQSTLLGLDVEGLNSLQTFQRSKEVARNL